MTSFSDHEQLLFYTAIGVFVLMVIGLLLTLWEYRHHIYPPNEDPQSSEYNPHSFDKDR